MQYTIGIEARARIVDFVREYRLKHSAISPSIREIQAACGISSPSVVKCHVDILVEAQELGRVGPRGASRCLFLVDGSDIPKREGD